MAVLEDILFFALDTFSEHPEKASLYSSIPYIAKINSLGSDWSVDRREPWSWLCLVVFQVAVVVVVVPRTQLPPFNRRRPPFIVVVVSLVYLQPLPPST